MKEPISLGVFGCLFAGLCVLAFDHNGAEKNRQVLLIVNEQKSTDPELMFSQEVFVMRDLLGQAGFQVVGATISGKLIEEGDIRFTPDLKLSAVHVTDYAGFIMPCMAPQEDEDPEFIRIAAPLIKEGLAQAKPVAAQLGSVRVLAEAGVLKGKRFAFDRDEVKDVPALKDAVYCGDGIVQDGMIITSGICPYMAKTKGIPDGTSALTRALIAELDGRGKDSPLERPAETREGR